MMAPDRNHVFFSEVSLDIPEGEGWCAPTGTDIYWTEGPAIVAESPEEALQYIQANVRMWPWPLGDGSELGSVSGVRVYRARLGTRVTVEEGAA